MTSTTQAQTYPKYARYKDSGVEWLGEIPEGWELQKFRYLFSFGRGLNITKEHLQETGIPCVNYGEIHSKYGFEVNPEKHNLKCVSDDYLFTSTRSLLQYGDFLFADTSEDISGSGNFTYLNSHEKVFAGYHTVIARPSSSSSSRYMAYLFDSIPFRSQIQMRVKGVKVFSITQAILKDAMLWIPPKEEQNRIVQFLDQKTAALDDAIAKKQRLIELLKEQKAILINRAVTRGLNPDVPMKDSGVEWIGEIPAHWSLSRLGFLGKIGNGSTPNRSNLSYWEKGGIPWLNSSKVNDYHINTAEQFITHKAFRECHLPLLQPGDIVIGITGQGKTRGMSAICNIKATINQHLAYIHLTSQNISNNYIHLYLSAIYKRMRIESDSNGSTKGAITCQDIKQYPIPLPPLSEQHQIHNYVSKKLQSINCLIKTHEDLISKLQEYKQTLIAHAVTGKIKVS